MKPIKFEQQNVVYAENQEQYIPLPANRNDEGDVITCWELSKEEIQKINETGKLWIAVKTFNSPLQPIFCTVLEEDLFQTEAP